MYELSSWYTISKYLVYPSENLVVKYARVWVTDPTEITIVVMLQKVTQPQFKCFHCEISR